MKELADLLDSRMKQHAEGALLGTLCVLGTITANGVKLDDFKHEIQDPMYADWLVKMTLPAFSISGSQTGLKDGQNMNVTGTAAWSYSSTDVDQVHIDLKSDLQVGDRVLCIPVNGGQDCAILCKVVT